MSNDFKKMGFGQTKVFKLPIVRWELWELKDLFLYDATIAHLEVFMAAAPYKPDHSALHRQRICMLSPNILALVVSAFIRTNGNG